MEAAQPNTEVSEPGVSEDNIANNPKRDDSSTEAKATENSGKPNAKEDTRTPQVGLKKNKKKTNHPPISDMVLESLKSLKMRKGAPAEAIREYIEGHYKVTGKYIRPYIKKFLKTGVEKGILEHVSGEGPNRRFKIKKPEAHKKDKQDAKQKKKKTVAQKGNLEVGKRGRPSGKIKMLGQEGIKNNEKVQLNQAKGKKGKQLNCC